MVARLLAVDGVGEARLPLARDFEADGERLAGFGALVRLRERQVAVGVAAVVNAFGDGCASRALGDLPLDVQVRAVFLRREVAVGLALLDETQRGGAVLVGVTRLEDDLLVVVR